jgi:hypothetical protein
MELVDRTISWHGAIRGIEECIPVLKFDPASRFGASDRSSVLVQFPATSELELTRMLVSSILASHEWRRRESVHE